jgi:glycosyltransferase involved in cell wall biosynthesis
MDDIIFAGHADTVLPYYQGADIFVLPSLSEGLPLSLLEAMSCGLPVVATIVGGNAEIVDPNLKTKEVVSDYHIGENGVLVNPKDVKGLAEAILKLLNDVDLSKQLGEKARKTVEENYSQEKIINEYIDLYCSLS